MGKQHSYSSYSENPGNSLQVLAESLGNFPPMKLLDTNTDPSVFQKKTEEDNWGKAKYSSSLEMYRAAGPTFSGPSSSSYMGSSSEADKDEAASTPANVLYSLRSSAPFDVAPSSSGCSSSISSSFGGWKADAIGGSQLKYFLANFESLHEKEFQLVDQIRRHLATPASFSEAETLDFQNRSKQLTEELHSITHSKTKLWNLFSELEESQPEINHVFDHLSSPNHLMTISQQPFDVAIANRYMGPAPIVEISPKYRLRDENASLVVSAMLFYQTAEKDQIKPLEGKHEVLQGIKKVPVDKNGLAVFHKLKITEVSSKHRHQAFCLVFSLEEYSAKGKKQLISSIKSSSFYVQSRPNNKKPLSKRKGYDSVEEIKDRKRIKNDRVDDPPSPQSSSDSGSPSFELYEANYVDITDLLTLPQKNAAQQLGISESMLCKRFKECTKRKWPYRYLRKIDKVIGMLTESKNGRVPHSEDKQKLARLVEERKECLRPVKIRITVHDKLSSPCGSPYKRSTPTPPSPSSDEGLDNQVDPQEEIILALEKLKSQK